jgi:hypothetical protein
MDTRKDIISLTMTTTQYMHCSKTTSKLQLLDLGFGILQKYEKLSNHNEPVKV